MVVVDLVHQDVVDEPAVAIQQAGVVRLADLQLGGVVGGNIIDELQRIRAADFDLAHVADVKNAGGAADGVVLLDDAGVLHGHVPAAKIDHFGAELTMDRV